MPSGIGSNCPSLRLSTPASLSIGPVSGGGAYPVGVSRGWGACPAGGGGASRGQFCMGLHSDSNSHRLAAHPAKLSATGIGPDTLPHTHCHTRSVTHATRPEREVVHAHTGSPDTQERNLNPFPQTHTKIINRFHLPAEELLANEQNHTTGTKHCGRILLWTCGFYTGDRIQSLPLPLGLLLSLVDTLQRSSLRRPVSEAARPGNCCPLVAERRSAGQSSLRVVKCWFCSRA